MEILGTTSENVAISLEASSNSIRNLLGVLTSGVTFTKEEGSFGEAIRTAELIGISVENWQIGKKKANPNSGTGVETRGLRNTNQSNNDRKIEKVKKSKIKHGTKIDKGRWRCDICGYKAKNLTTIQKHIKTHSNKHKFACSRCFYTFKNGKSLDDHISIAHMNNSSYKETEEDSSQNRDESENLKLWTRKSIGWSCNICGHCTSRKKKVLVHIQTHLKAHTHSCHLCSYTFKNTNSLRKHITIFHSNDASLNNSKYEDNVKEEEEEYIETEKSNCHESNNNNEPVTLRILKESDEKMYQLNDTGDHVCLKCGTVIKSRKHFIRHWNKHIGVKFRCNYCGADFSRRDKLLKHIREQHEGTGDASPTSTGQSTCDRSSTDEEN